MSEHTAGDPSNELSKKNRHSRLQWQQLIASATSGCSTNAVILNVFFGGASVRLLLCLSIWLIKMSVKVYCNLNKSHELLGEPWLCGFLLQFLVRTHQEQEV